MGDLSRIKGNKGQKLADEELHRRGVRMIRSIPTLKRAGRYVRKTAADTIGVIPGTGQSVIMETKAYDDVLRWSALRDDQHNRLAEHNMLGGISLVCWVDGIETYIMRYPIPGFAPRKSITPDVAKSLQWYAPQPQRGFAVIDGNGLEFDTVNWGELIASDDVCAKFTDELRKNDLIVKITRHTDSRFDQPYDNYALSFRIWECQR